MQSIDWVTKYICDRVTIDMKEWQSNDRYEGVTCMRNRKTRYDRESAEKKENNDE